MEHLKPDVDERLSLDERLDELSVKSRYYQSGGIGMELNFKLRAEDVMQLTQAAQEQIYISTS